MEKAIWSRWEFGIYRMEGDWNDVPGVYIFAGVNAANLWSALYVGQAQSFKQRMYAHERWSEARRRGATHVHALVERDAVQRDRIEAALVRWLQPPLNTLLRAS